MRLTDSPKSEGKRIGATFCMVVFLWITALGLANCFYFFGEGQHLPPDPEKERLLSVDRQKNPP